MCNRMMDFMTEGAPGTNMLSPKHPSYPKLEPDFFFKTTKEIARFKRRNRVIGTMPLIAHKPGEPAEPLAANSHADTSADPPPPTSTSAPTQPTPSDKA